MKGLTAKVFRTFNASITFQRLLDEEDLKNATLQEKLNAYNHANRKVAILCNHQRSVPKTHEQSMEKMRYKVLVSTGFPVMLLMSRLASNSEIRSHETPPCIVQDRAQVQEEC